ncbi:hypothetical protein [Marivita sp.]|uniref:hypothetical protein n=1 Tax=Marivita sp. TaxID=2003365 RepID=UPI0025BA209F|nr:hypothetical protein [Marivita sp.]
MSVPRAAADSPHARSDPKARIARVRPKGAHRAGKTLGLGHQPASTNRVHSRWTADEVADLSLRLRDITPGDR